MIYLAAYDITDNRLRLKLAKRLVAVGLERIQYSVFVGPLTETLYQNLQQEITQLLMVSNPVQDRCVIMPITKRTLEAHLHWGQPLDVDYLCGEQEVLFL